MKTRMRARIEGRVQGVGFRPTVYRYATQLGLNGYVCNDPQGVTLEVEGDQAELGAFFDQLEHHPPGQSVITSIEAACLPAAGYERFEITDSEPSGDAAAHVPPDLATCDDCVQDTLAAADRRHRYPFTNCTNCGPRFTILRGLPYDRLQTSMAGFSMCPDCAREYEDPHDRRFHAQPTACPACGPHLELQGRDGRIVRDGAFEGTVELLRQGAIVAIKSLGGYHLACDPFHSTAVAELRRRKRRPHKPFAVMFRDLTAIREHCQVSEVEEAELLGSARPIVILNRSHAEATAALPDTISPDTDTVGAFLPYTPLHHLLMQEFPALIMTSGNLTDEPIISDETELGILLGPIADAALANDRPIVHNCDDSVVQVVNGQRHFLRRARGFVPNPIRLALGSPAVLAVGGELKTTFCVVRDGFAFLSQHLGDLKDYRTYEYFDREIAAWQRLMRVSPEIIAHDLHPNYLSTRWTLSHTDSQSAILVPVQHHHAHVASVMAEHELQAPVIGVALDGTGYGPDGTVWGGEFLVADRAAFERVGHFKLYPLPGGDRAVAEPWRMAAGIVFCEGYAPLARRFLDRLPKEQLAVLEAMIDAGRHTPWTSSAGRLFDAVAALMGLGDTVTYEAQAAIRLEQAVDPAVTDRYPFAFQMAPTGWVLDFGPTVRAVLEQSSQGRPVEAVAARFHHTLVNAIIRLCELVREQRGLTTVVLSGGVFQNRRLLVRAIADLRERLFTVFTNNAVPPNDGGLALGQAAVAVARSQQPAQPQPGSLEDSPVCA